ncbi:hypothetical protein IGI49_000018 [Enterococcus sp. AZ071]
MEKGSEGLNGTNEYSFFQLGVETEFISQRDLTGCTLSIYLVTV